MTNGDLGATPKFAVILRGGLSYPRTATVPELTVDPSSGSGQRGSRRTRDHGRGPPGVTTRSQVRRFGGRHF